MTVQRIRDRHRPPNEAELRLGLRIAKQHGIDLATAIELLREVW